MLNKNTCKNNIISKQISEAPFSSLQEEEINEIVKSYGTPLFVLQKDCLEDNFKKFQSKWESFFNNSRIYYSYKTNYLPEICKFAHSIGYGADAVSGYELEHAARLCVEGPIVFNGPMKTEAEIEFALDIKATINIDCKEELDIVEKLKFKKDFCNIKLGLRVNPGKPLFKSADQSFITAHTKGTKVAKFGWPIGSGHALSIAQSMLERNLLLNTIHCHLSSQITDWQSFIFALKDVLDFTVLAITMGHPINEINIGGGFGVPGLIRERRGWHSGKIKEQGGSLVTEESESFDLNSFCSCFAEELKKRKLDHLIISCEPGRFLVSNSTVLLSKVVGIKRLEQKNWTIIDAGLNILPTASFGEKREIAFFPDAKYQKKLSLEEEESKLGGPLCYEGDVVMDTVSIPVNLAAGDTVMISDAGAYTVSRSTNFNRLRAAVVLIGKNVPSKLIWKRETYNDVFKFSTTHEINK